MAQSKNCIQCGKSFNKPYSCGMPEWSRRKFCVKHCADVFKTGKPFTHSKQFKKGQRAWNKGKNGLIPEHKHYAWKGDDVSYSGVHHWIKKHLGSPTKCKHCGTDGLSGRKIHWANKDHTYRRIVDDWIRLCVNCHIEFDRTHNREYKSQT